MVAVFATATSWLLLMQFVTIPYVLVPVMELWSQVSIPLVEWFFGSPEAFTGIFDKEPAAVGIAGFIMWGIVASAVISVPVLVIVGIPLVVSYVVWMEIVYKRVLGE